MADHTYFVTIRLKGSLPHAVMEDLERERTAFLQKNPKAEEINDFHRLRLLRIEAILDSAKHGSSFLCIASVAEVVMAAFLWLERRHRWHIRALTVMPNHVHLLLRNLDGKNHLLNQHLGVVKGFSAREANRLLRRRGDFWMNENFDHWCRTSERVVAAAQYILDNPVKAGLVENAEDWPWTLSREK